MDLKFLIEALTEYYEVHGNIPVYVGSHMSDMSPVRSVGMTASNYGAEDVEHIVTIHFSPKEAVNFFRK